jgi:hypothetical protein
MSSAMKHLSPLPAALSAFALALAAGSAHAEVVNGDFGNGLAGWTTGGDAAVVGQHLSLSNAYPDGTDDVDGVVRNLSGTAPLGAGQPGGLEDTAGLAPGALDPDSNAGSTATEGSVATQRFDAAAGSLLSFRWDLATADLSGDRSFADLAFVVVDGSLFTLDSILGATLPTTGGDYAAHTGWADWSMTLAGAGTHTIAFGIADIGDFTGSSALQVSDVRVSAVPESPTLALMAAGLGLLALQARRRNA